MNEEPSPSTRTGRIWPIIKLILFCVVVVFVIRRAAQIWESAPAESIQLQPFWLIPASLAYLIGWLPSAWFWTALLKRIGQPIDFGTAIRAYYVSQLGKYVPGKALVLVIRGAMVKESGIDPLLAGLMAAYETLVFMAAGTALGLVSAPWAFGDAFWTRLPTWMRGFAEHRVAFAVAVSLAAFATTPVSAWLFNRLTRRAFLRSTRSEAAIPRLTASLITQGVFATSLSWLCNAFSLGFVLRAVSDPPLDVHQFPIWLAAAAWSIVGGFVVLIAPGGLGVREGLLIESLQGQPEIGPATAIVAAGLLRATWFGSEIAAAILLYAIHRIVAQRAPSARIS